MFEGPLTAFVVDNACAILGTLLVTTVVSVVTVGSCLCPCRRPELAADLEEISYTSQIRVARNKTTVTAPQWDPGVANDGQGSTRPGVYLVQGQGAAATLRVKVRVTRSAIVSPVGDLLGTLGGLSFKARCPTAAGVHTVDALMTGVPSTIAHVRGDAQWSLQTPELTAALSNTRLELFFVLKAPETCHVGAPVLASASSSDSMEEEDQNACYREAGVWVEVLRFLCLHVQVTGLGTPADAVKRITTYCHGGHGLAYDSKSWYMKDDRNQGIHMFDLNAYLSRTSPKANCSDQAGALTVLSRAIGAPVTMLIMDPFGYIKTTRLMERDNCNNPTPNPEHPNFVDIYKRDDWVSVRWGFTSHVFCELDGLIYDACTGPHMGLSRAAYVEAAVDADPHFFAKQMKKEVPKKKGPAPYKSKQQKERERVQEEKAYWDKIGKMNVNEVDISVATAPTDPGTVKNIYPFIVLSKLL